MKARTPLPETITIYHTSPIENLKSILKHGVTTAKFDFEKCLAIIEGSKVAKWKKIDAKDRLLECFGKGEFSGYVCCSGNKEYSIINGSASKEFLVYLADKKNKYNGKGKRVCFKIVLPIRILEISTPRFWREIIERFESLWCESYFAKRMWIARHLNKKHNGFKNVSKPLDTNPIKGYDHFYLTFVSPEYIESFEIYEGEN